jgi:peptide/nickel transport system ATP-binding protein
MPADILLDLRDVKVHFPFGKELFKPARMLRAVDGVSLSIRRGTSVGIVGESGSGKTTLALAVMRLIDITDGTIMLDGIEISRLTGAALRAQRHRVQMVFQDPYSSLNPRARAHDIVAEPLELMGVGTRAERAATVDALFRQVGLRADQMNLFPHQFSGGQRQRIGIARALATKPSLVVCDEPVSALDVAIQAQILNLLGDLQREYRLSYLFISHDLAVVQHLCDEVAVMYLGQIVERASRDQLFSDPLHPYTWALLAAVPRMGRRGGKDKATDLGGDPPSPIDLPSGCRYAGRCAYAKDICRSETPRLRQLADGHAVACHLVTDVGTAPHRPEKL